MPVADVNLEIVARHTSGLTGADLANLCNEAAIMAGRESRDVIAQQDFDAALERVIAGLQTRRVITPHEKKVIAYHEAGHALISELLPSVPKVHKVSIIPRGRALGFTLNLPEEDRYLMSREDLLDYMKMLLGGYVTEQVVFERVTTGASDDLRRVAEISRSMIYEYGMGSKLLAHLDGAKTDGVSQAMLEARDDEQQLLIEEAQFEAREMITENRDLLDRLAAELLAKEALDRAEIVEIVAAAKGDGAEVPPVVRLPSIVVEEKLAASSGEAAPEKPSGESIGPPPSTSNRASRQSVPPPPVNRA
jgi:cell division protease FtsH